jgi:nucleotide-binding universal stress UspA family protein
VVAAQLVAARLDLPLEVISVLEPTPTYTMIPDVVIVSDPGIDDARRYAQEITVRDFVSRFAGGATPPRVRVRFGDVAAEIGRFAREVSATMVIMASPRHRRLRRMPASDRAAQVLHSARCPVLSVPPTFSALPRTIVAAIDFGPSSLRAAQAALLLVDHGGTVLLTHIVPPVVRPAALNAVRENDLDTNVRALLAEARDEIAVCAPPGVRVETRLVADDAADGILTTAIDADADLIAVGTHGSGFISRLLMGSVAESVMHGAEQPVLASPPSPPKVVAPRRPLSDETRSAPERRPTTMTVF